MADLSEREVILQYLVTILGDTTGVKFVSRDYGIVLAGQVDEHPAIFVIDIGDKVVEPEAMSRANHRTLTVGIVFVIKGSTRAEAPEEMAAFQRLAKQQLYSQIYSCTKVSRFVETGMSHLSFSEVDPKEVHQGMQCEIDFIENVLALINN